MNDPNSILAGYLSDMAAVEKHILEAVERQLETDNLTLFPEAHAVVSRLDETLRRHLDTLQREIESRDEGDYVEILKKALTGALGFVAGMYNKVRSEDDVSRMIRDNYTATSLAAVSYQMLHTTALGLHDQRVADMAVMHLRDLTPILVEMSKVICTVVARELAEEDKVFDGTVGHQAIENTQQAWSTSEPVAVAP